MKRQQMTIGAIIKIDLENGYYNYAQILKNGIAFFDANTTDAQPKDLSFLLEAPILFIIGTYNSPVTEGRWLKVGKLPIRNALKEVPIQFIQDKLNRSIFQLYDPNTGETRNATREECDGLESAAVWGADHVEDRLRDHYKGVSNKWVNSLSIK